MPKTPEEILADRLEAELINQPQRLYRMQQLEVLVRAMNFVIHYDKTPALHVIPWCQEKYARCLLTIGLVAQKPDNS